MALAASVPLRSVYLLAEDPEQVVVVVVVVGNLWTVDRFASGRGGTERNVTTPNCLIPGRALRARN